eukprot:PhM_4_TR2808/c0_g2_i1/m.29784
MNGILLCFFVVRTTMRKKKQEVEEIISFLCFVFDDNMELFFFLVSFLVLLVLLLVVRVGVLDNVLHDGGEAQATENDAALQHLAGVLDVRVREDLVVRLELVVQVDVRHGVLEGLLTPGREVAVERRGAAGERVVLHEGGGGVLDERLRVGVGREGALGVLAVELTDGVAERVEVLGRAAHVVDLDGVAAAVALGEVRRDAGRRVQGLVEVTREVEEVHEVEGLLVRRRGGRRQHLHGLGEDLVELTAGVLGARKALGAVAAVVEVPLVHGRVLGAEVIGPARGLRHGVDALVLLGPVRHQGREVLGRRGGGALGDLSREHVAGAVPRVDGADEESHEGERCDEELHFCSFFS